MATAPIKLPSILQSLAAPGANPADVQSARDQMTMEIAPQEASITGTINQIQGYLDRDIAAQQQYGQVADQKISEVGQQLAQKLQGNVGAIGNIYQAGQNQVGSIYDQATAATQAAGTSIRDRLNQGAAALGQTQALKADPYGNDPISRLLAQQASAETRLASGKAGSQANLATLGTQLQGIAQKAVGDSERNFADKRSRLTSDVLATISKLQLGGQEGIQEQLRKYSILAETAGPAFRTLIGQAASARSKAEMDAAKYRLEVMSKMAEINKDNAAAAKSSREEDPNSLDNQLKMLNIGLKGFELDEKTGAPKYRSDTEGQQSLMDYLNSVVRKDRKSPGISGTEHAGIQSFINQNLPQATMSGLYNTTDPVKILASIAQGNIDPKTGKVNLPVTSGSQYGQGDYQTDLQTLMDALAARFQHVGSSTKTGTRIK